jgi:hypothetical protein
MIYVVLVLLSGDRDLLNRLGPMSMFLPENGDRFHSPKRCINKNRTMDNVQNVNHYTVVKHVNLIQGRGTDHRQFISLLQHLDA